ncbi:MAG: hypothetical protein KatS3mg103_0850 [Phycisphaerales bacterium]|nr:MAG: hypothetical protein KatS3mg103_0850 [Phycisphaerales bacterium]
MEIDQALLERAKASARRSWLARLEHMVQTLGLAVHEAAMILDEPATASLFDDALQRLADDPQTPQDPPPAQALAKAITQRLAALANERKTTIAGLGLRPGPLAQAVQMRLAGRLSSNAADRLLELLADDRDADAGELAQAHGLLMVTDATAIDAWCRSAIDAHPQAAEQVRQGKAQAIGRLIGHAMQQAGGAGDPKAIRRRLLELLASSP